MKLWPNRDIILSRFEMASPELLDSNLNLYIYAVKCMVNFEHIL
jgi:hypothetical protein